ncbi:DUF418 domain-containing protein [Qipengyuania sp. 1NDH17]|uniref:DUF418 domain-containing protein n=1 Tax=Qipengyuania polymorpha TaxID=2867234 RepID=A0ABS7IUU7_9SPHN|nr:DUF418 domain-containing protein [Qipengyuania polymorpha]MBX7457204.1 DUF418 domain-containing protein [Qipengyuania polymorpha]
MSKTSDTATGIAPITSTERFGELDILRGFALLAVFVVHFVGASFYDLPLEESLSESWNADVLQRGAVFLSDWWFENKGNTLFATLFGMGFWVMMERLEARGSDFQRIYLRRLTALFLIGLVHLFLLFPMDVLHEYALLGFALFFMRKLSAPAMLVLGLVLAFVGQPLGDFLAGELVTGERAESRWQEVFAGGSYAEWVAWWPGWHLYLEIERGGLLGWALYILGRFLLGAWIIRMGFVARARELLPLMRRICLVALPLGLVLELVSLLQWMELLPKTDWSDTALHEIGGPILALGYATGLILLYHSNWRGWVAQLAPVGRTALSAYVGHGVAWTFLFFPMGLGMQGRLTPAASMLVALGLFAAFTLAAKFWLARYRYGPLEYLWRWATYGSRPKFRLQPAAA